MLLKKRVFLAFAIGVRAAWPIESGNPAFGDRRVFLESNVGQGLHAEAFRVLGRSYVVSLLQNGSAVYSFPREQSSLRMDFFQSLPAAFRGEQPLSSVTHLYSGLDGVQKHLVVPQWGQARYTGIYAGIDLVYRGDGPNIEFDFVISPGADPAQIQVLLHGILNSRIDESGNLYLKAKGGEVRYRKPLAYQMAGTIREPIPAEFYLKAGVLTFRLGAYDRSRPLVIDPLLDFVSFFPGSGYEATYAVASDATGIYIAGETDAAPAGTSGTGRNAFVTKLAKDGSTVLYTTILAGSGTDTAKAIRVDSAGNAYVAGVAGGTGFPVTADALSRNFAGMGDGFLTRLDATGKIAYSTYLGASGSDAVTGLALDPSNNIYVTGYTSSTRFPTSTGGPQTIYAGGYYDSFVMKLNPAGNQILYSTLAGGSANDTAAAIAVNSAGRACITGYSESADLKLSNPLRSVNRGGEAFVGCLDPAGTAWDYLSYLGGTSVDEGDGIFVDDAGQVYVAGTTMSSDFPTTSSALQTTKRSDRDVFVAKLSATGASLVYSTFVGGSGMDAATTITVEASGYAWVCGFTSSTDFPLLQPAKAVYGGGFDGFVFRLSPGLAPA